MVSRPPSLAACNIWPTREVRQRTKFSSLTTPNLRGEGGGGFWAGVTRNKLCNCCGSRQKYLKTLTDLSVHVNKFLLCVAMRGAHPFARGAELLQFFSASDVLQNCVAACFSAANYSYFGPWQRSISGMSACMHCLVTTKSVPETSCVANESHAHGETAAQPVSRNLVLRAHTDLHVTSFRVCRTESLRPMW